VWSLGVITPHAAAGSEAEWPLMVPRQIVTRIARIPAPGATAAAPGTPPTSPAGLRTLADPAAMNDAAASFGGPGSVDAIGLASTSMGYVIGGAAESALLQKLSLRCNVPVDGASAAAVTALRVMDIERVELVHPPWFDDEMNELGNRYFQNEGFNVIASMSAALPSDPQRIEADEVITWISHHVNDDAQAVFIGGNGFRVATAIERLEHHVGRPVLASNQVLLWSLLGKLRVRSEVCGYGSLFQQSPPSTGTQPRPSDAARRRT
jgi:maleate isomerase